MKTQGQAKKKQMHPQRVTVWYGFYAGGVITVSLRVGRLEGVICKKS